MYRSCEKCGGIGWRYDAASNTAHRCRCQYERAALAKLDKLPPQLRKQTAENFEVSRLGEESAGAVGRMFGRPYRGVLLSGRVGVGKTHLLSAKYQLHVAASAYEPLCWYTADEVAEELRLQALYGHEEPQPLFERIGYRRPFHLYWDDVDKMRLTESADAYLFRLLNGMTTLGCRISATSNVGLAELARLWNPALARRLGEMVDGTVVVA